jgi:hypothetical protein
MSLLLKRLSTSATNGRWLTFTIVFAEKCVEMCKVHWTDENSFRQASNSSGFSLGISYVTFGFSQSGASAGGDYNAAYAKYCNMSDQEYISQQASSGRTVDAQPALAAWLACVRDQRGLFIYAQEAPNFDYVDLRLIHKDIRSGFNIWDINKEASVTCSAGNTPVNPTRDNPYLVPIDEFTIRCTKPAELATTFSLNTDAGAPIQIQARGTALSEAELRQLQAQVQNNTSQLQAVESNVKKLLERHPRVVAVDVIGPLGKVTDPAANFDPGPNYFSHSGTFSIPGSKDYSICALSDPFYQSGQPSYHCAVYPTPDGGYSIKTNEYANCRATCFKIDW